MSPESLTFRDLTNSASGTLLQRHIPLSTPGAKPPFSVIWTRLHQLPDEVYSSKVNISEESLLNDCYLAKNQSQDLAILTYDRVHLDFDFHYILAPERHRQAK